MEMGGNFAIMCAEEKVCDASLTPIYSTTSYFST